MLPWNWFSIDYKWNTCLEIDSQQLGSCCDLGTSDPVFEPLKNLIQPAINHENQIEFCLFRVLSWLDLNEMAPAFHLLLKTCLKISKWMRLGAMGAWNIQYVSRFLLVNLILTYLKYCPQIKPTTNVMCNRQNILKLILLLLNLVLLNATVIKTVCYSSLDCVDSSVCAYWSLQCCHLFNFYLILHTCHVNRSVYFFSV